MNEHDTTKRMSAVTTQDVIRNIGLRLLALALKRGNYTFTHDDAVDEAELYKKLNKELNKELRKQ